MGTHPDSKRILVVDIGGSNIKLLATGEDKRIKIPSARDLTPQKLVEQVVEATREWQYDVVSVGCPCACSGNKPVRDPHNLGDGWIGFDFEKAFGLPCLVINDAAMQALGSYISGTMLFLGLGTGLGVTLIKDGTIVPLEAGHMPYRKRRSYEEYTGKAGFERLGFEKWQKHVLKIIELFRHGFVVDDVVLGGGNAKLIEELPANTRRVNNHAAFDGGFRLWE
ncbi:ROK family protein [Persicirhabdus sediminis]|uniref:ROK family protein n=1 Tax=Persicirhabdus sediminis TaxID=454144 RepID=A0A8J7MGU0_9BACT|nr:ROK family protein [Persicirhabdus sediminis]MBK1792792.1 ROK family protein [Persicirhabdus sediminis]